MQLPSEERDQFIQSLISTASLRQEHITALTGKEPSYLSISELTNGLIPIADRLIPVLDLQPSELGPLMLQYAEDLSQEDQQSLQWIEEYNEDEERDVNAWSFSLTTHRPVYIPILTKIEIDKLQVLLTPINQEYFPPALSSKILKDPLYSSRLLSFYTTPIPDLSIFIPSPTESIRRIPDRTKDWLLKNRRVLSNQEIPLGDYLYGLTIQQGDLRIVEYYEGYRKEFTYSTNLIESKEHFEALLNTIIRKTQSQLDLVSIFTVFCYYSDPDGTKAEKVMISRFSNLEIPTIQLHSVLLDTLIQNGSDPSTLETLRDNGKKNNLDKVLNISLGIVVTEDVIQKHGAGSFIKPSDWIEGSTILRGRHQCQRMMFSINNIRYECEIDLTDQESHCLLVASRILGYHKREAIKPINTLFLESFGHNGAFDISTEEALRYLDKAFPRISITIIDVQGTTLGSTQRHRDYKGRNAMIILVKGHYLPIVAQSSTLHIKDLPTEDTEVPKGGEALLIFYDFETVFLNGLAIPYSISYAVNNGEVKTLSSYRPSEQLIESFIDELPKEPLCLVGYNGAKFDHVFMWKFLVKRGKVAKCVQGNKIHSSLLYYKGRSFSFWDPNLYLHTSLKKASKDFGLELSKGQLDHKGIQLHFESNGDLEGIIDMRALKEYNEMDVKVLRELTWKIVEVYQEFGYPNVLKNPTIASMSMKIAKEMNEGLKSKVKIIKYPKDWTLDRVYGEIDRLSRESMVGGRTGVMGYFIPRSLAKPLDLEDPNGPKGSNKFGSFEGFEGFEGDFRKEDLEEGWVYRHLGYGAYEFEEPYCMVDVKSLYPFVMLIKDFPEPMISLFSHIDECPKGMLRNGMYIMMVRYRRTEDKVPVLPKRMKDRRLDWYPPVNEWISEVTTSTSVQLMLQYGFEVEYGGGMIVYFHKKSKVFKEFIETFKRVKEDEDRKRKEGRSYNKAKREMGKLALNSLSGKVAQKNYEEQRCIVRSKEDYLGWLKSIDSGDGLAEILKSIKDSGYRIEQLDDRTAVIEWKKEIKLGSSNIKAPWLASFIYSYARWWMYIAMVGVMREGGKVMYMDTDSMLIPERVLGTIKVGEDFGDFEVEEMGVWGADIIAPKVYRLRSKDGTLKWRAKGLGRDSKYEGTDMLVVEDVDRLFKELVEKGECVVEDEVIRRDVKKGIIMSMRTKRTLNLRDI